MPIFYKYFSVTLHGNKGFYLNLTKTSEAERKFLYSALKGNFSIKCEYDTRGDLKERESSDLFPTAFDEERVNNRDISNVKNLLYQKVNIDKIKETCLLKAQKIELRNRIMHCFPREGFLLMTPWVDLYDRGERLRMYDIYQHIYISNRTCYFLFNSIEEVKEAHQKLNYPTIEYIELLPEKDLNIVRLLISLPFSNFNRGSRLSSYEEINNLLTLFTVKRITPIEYIKRTEMRKTNRRTVNIPLSLNHPLNNLNGINTGSKMVNDAPDIIPPFLEV